MYSVISSVLSILVVVLCSRMVLTAQTPVETHGALSVSGNKIVDKNNLPVQLRGISLFWSQWQGKYYNAEVIAALKNDWNVTVVRAAMAVDNGGYAKNKNEQDKVIAIVDAAIKQGIYVIIDFHVHNADQYVKEAKTFFTAMAQRYGAYPNIIYEPWNEPIEHSWSEVIKPYHQSIIEVIRQYDPDNLIICGTRRWSQEVTEASLDPLKGKNIAYTLHFYAATHKQALRDNAQQALNNGIALMVTEYGICEATGDGLLDKEETQRWWEFLDTNHITHCNWALSDKAEAASVLQPGASATGAWTDRDLTPSGIFVKEEIKSKNQVPPAN